MSCRRTPWHFSLSSGERVPVWELHFGARGAHVDVPHEYSCAPSARPFLCQLIRAGRCFGSLTPLMWGFLLLRCQGAISWEPTGRILLFIAYSPWSQKLKLVFYMWYI